MKRLIYGLIILLTILHQDFWWWDDSETLAFGFIPIGLAYHAGISIAAAILWTMAVRYCWPKDVDTDDHIEELAGDGAVRTSHSQRGRGTHHSGEERPPGRAGGSWETNS